MFGASRNELLHMITRLALDLVDMDKKLKAMEEKIEVANKNNQTLIHMVDHLFDLKEKDKIYATPDCERQ